MLFNSIEFAIFLPVVLAAYYCLSTRPQNVFLLGASYVFYGWWDWRFLGLLWITTLVDFTVARAIDAAAGQQRRKALLSISVVTNLTILGFFKYFNFFADSATSLLENFGMHPSPITLHVLLPVGISFYTFQSMSYVVDVFRGKMAHEKNLLHYALYVAFFPQLVAGPIERADHLIRQLSGRRTVTFQLLYSGSFLLLLGFFKKLAIADSVAPEVAQIFGDVHHASWWTLMKGLWLFAIQIYCDFSGYSDIARGCGRLMGVELRENFNQPYLSANITEFWRRWHISLSSWLRDYLYIPLGGSRNGKVRTYRNLLLTMLLGGLWHGASWNFVIWGGLHGTYLAIHKLILGGRDPMPKRDKLTPGQQLRWFFGVVVTLHLVLVAWVFFRASSLPVALEYITRILSFSGGLEAVSFGDFVTLLWFCLLLLAVDLPQYISRSHTAVLSWAAPARGLAMAAMVLVILLVGTKSETPFIYFQF